MYRALPVLTLLVAIAIGATAAASRDRRAAFDITTIPTVCVGRRPFLATITTVFGKFISSRGRLGAFLGHQRRTTRAHKAAPRFLRTHGGQAEYDFVADTMANPRLAFEGQPLNVEGPDHLVAAVRGMSESQRVGWARVLRGRYFEMKRQGTLDPAISGASMLNIDFTAPDAAPESNYCGNAGMEGVVADLLYRDAREGTRQRTAAVVQKEIEAVVPITSEHADELASNAFFRRRRSAVEFKATCQLISGTSEMPKRSIAGFHEQIAQTEANTTQQLRAQMMADVSADLTRAIAATWRAVEVGGPIPKEAKILRPDFVESLRGHLVDVARTSGSTRIDREGRTDSHESRVFLWLTPMQEAQDERASRVDAVRPPANEVDGVTIYRLQVPDAKRYETIANQVALHAAARATTRVGVAFGTIAPSERPSLTRTMNMLAQVHFGLEIDVYVDSGPQREARHSAPIADSSSDPLFAQLAFRHWQDDVASDRVDVSRAEGGDGESPSSLPGRSRIVTLESPADRGVPVQTSELE